MNRSSELVVSFRVDSSLQIGTGHVIRCLTLASGLREKGAQCFFIISEHPGHLQKLIEEKGFRTFLLSSSELNFRLESDEPYHASWLGRTWRDDAEQVCEILNQIRPDWLIVDHYGIDCRWETALCGSFGKLMVIDDLADRNHNCDLLLDQNLFESMVQRYQDKLLSKCVLLLGPEYALLQPAYAKLHNCVVFEERLIKRIFVYFGGADNSNLTGKTLHALQKFDHLDIRIDVVISSSSQHAELIKQQIKNQANIYLHEDMPTLAPLMLQADIAIGGGGTTTWERFCLGLPALVISLAENQRPVTKYLHDVGLVRWIGHVDEIDDKKIAYELERVLNMPNLVDWSNRCYKQCSGNGLSKVVETLLASTLN